MNFFHAKIHTEAISGLKAKKALAQHFISPYPISLNQKGNNKQPVFCVLLLCTYHGFSQVYITRNGTIRFFPEAPLENIEGVNRQVSSALLMPLSRAELSA